MESSLCNQTAGISQERSEIHDVNHPRNGDSQLVLDWLGRLAGWSEPQSSRWGPHWVIRRF